METFFYLRTAGHRTGRTHEIEIWFVTHDGRHYLVSEHGERSHWVQNIRHNGAVSYRIGREAAWTPGTGRAVLPDDEPELAQTVRALMDAKYGWSDGLIVEIAERPEP